MVFLLNINCCNINQDGSISQGIFIHFLENKKGNFYKYYSSNNSILFIYIIRMFINNIFILLTAYYKGIIQV